MSNKLFPFLFENPNKLFPNIYSYTIGPLSKEKKPIKEREQAY